jgi:hypothetical protein
VASDSSGALAGYQNVFIGYNIASSSSLAGAFQNTAVGGSTLTALTTGDGNSVFGQGAGNSITTGGTNTCIGRDAGTDVTTGGNNFFIGYNTGTTGSPGGSVGTGNNEGVLGNSDVSKINVQVSLTVASDKRDKTDIEPSKLGLEFINQLEPVTYRWDKRHKYLSGDADLDDIVHDGTHKEDWLDIGLLAQDVEKIEAKYGYNIADKTNLTTSLTSDGKKYGLQYEKFVPILIKAVKELSSKVEELENKLNNKE